MNGRKKERRNEKRLHTPQPLHPHPEQSPLQAAQLEQVQGAILDDDKAADDDDVVVISVCFYFPVDEYRRFAITEEERKLSTPEGLPLNSEQILPVPASLGSAPAQLSSAQLCCPT